MKYLLMVVLLFSLVLCSGFAFSVAFSSFYDGQELSYTCEVSPEACATYISGVADAGRGTTWDGVPYCVPMGVSSGQLNKVVIKFLNDHPESLHFAAASLTQRALLEAFPCE